MSFHREQIIKKPRKQYCCDWCGKRIDGEHLYIVGHNDDFYTLRIHIQCDRTMENYCYEKGCRHDCQGSMMDCYFEMKQEQKIKED